MRQYAYNHEKGKLPPTLAKIRFLSEVDQAALDAVMAAQYGPRTKQYGLRPRQLRKYSHLFALAYHIVASQAIKQMSMKKGLKMFGEVGVSAE